MEFSSNSEGIYQSDSPMVLSKIYEPATRLVVWRRTLDPQIIEEAQKLLNSKNHLNAFCIINSKDAPSLVSDFLNLSPGHLSLGKDIFELVEMFSMLFDLNSVGIRLKSLQNAMCPRFHIDHVPCRLVTTYIGLGTECLVEASILQTPEISGQKSFSHNHNERMILQLMPGDVVLLKGEKWVGNSGHCGIHRSPALDKNQSRLLLTMDFAA